MKKVKFVNYWENHRYVVNNKQVKLLNVIINGETYPVIHHNVTVNYYDHGHEHSATSLHHFVKSNFGTLVDLSEIKADIYVEEGDYVALYT